MTPERKADIEALLGLPSKPKPKPKVVASEGRVIRDAEVRVSPADPNAQHGDTLVHVRRAEFVTIMAEAERQWWMREQNRAYEAERQLYDPFNLWGPYDD